ncbi:MAG: hypothetical protein O6939_04120 [Bacteroidetes bacterium]|nr:hypothetical protein [Bacteroidota bacterium]
MKYLLLTIWLLIGTDNTLTRIARINELKKQAQEAFLKKDFVTAAEKYKFLIDSMNVKEDQVWLNLAHANYELKDSTQAKNGYLQLTSSTNHQIKSLAYQQLGVMETEKQNFEKSLSLFKASLKADPTNEESRYNYELLKKMMQEQDQQNHDQDQENQEQQNHPDKNRDQQDQQNNQKQDQQDQKENQQQPEDQEGGNQDQREQQQQEQEQQNQQEESKGQQQESKLEQQNQDNQQQQEQAQPKSTVEKLEEMNITEEKARMILEAMRNNEIQYIQQKQRKATERPDSGKPDW